MCRNRNKHCMKNIILKLSAFKNPNQLVDGEIHEEKLVQVVTTISNNNDTKLVGMLDTLNDCTETTRNK